MKRLILFLIILFCFPSMVCALPTSPDTGIGWPEVTERVDGSEYLVAERGGYKVYCKFVSDPDFTDSLSILVTGTNVLFTDLPCYAMPGKKDYGVTAIDTQDREGEMGVPTGVPFIPQRGPNVDYTP